MEVIVDELQKNGIRIDMTLLNTHVNRILCVYKAMYDEATSRLKADQLVDVFHENCFNTVARVMAYLILIRCMNLPKEEEDVRKAVRLVVPSLKNIIRVDGITSLKNAPIPEQIFIYVLCSSIGYTPMDIEYYIKPENF